MVNPARAGMILRALDDYTRRCGKPRASGDDPRQPERRASGPRRKPRASGDDPDVNDIAVEAVL